MVLYKKIKQLRESAKMTQDELAQKMGYKSRSSINKIEMGLSDIPPSKIEGFAKIFGCSPAYLMGWDEEERESDELDEIIQQLKDRPEMRALFSKTAKASKEDVLKTIKMIDVFREENHDL